MELRSRSAAVPAEVSVAGDIVRAPWLSRLGEAEVFKFLEAFEEYTSIGGKHSIPRLISLEVKELLTLFAPDAIGDGEWSVQADALRGLYRVVEPERAKVVLGSVSYTPGKAGLSVDGVLDYVLRFQKHGKRIAKDVLSERRRVKIFIQGIKHQLLRESLEELKLKSWKQCVLQTKELAERLVRSEFVTGRRGMDTAVPRQLGSGRVSGFGHRDGRSSDKKVGGCFECGSTDHKVKDCPKKQGNRGAHERSGRVMSVQTVGGHGLARGKDGQVHRVGAQGAFTDSYDWDRAHYGSNTALQMAMDRAAKEYGLVSDSDSDSD